MSLMERAWALVKTSLFGSAFIAFFVMYIPWTWSIRGQPADYAGWSSPRLLAVIPLVVGAYIVPLCLRFCLDRTWHASTLRSTTHPHHPRIISMGTQPHLPRRGSSGDRRDCPVRINSYRA